MDISHQLIYHNLDIIFFVYGLAFVAMGIAILLQPKKTSEFEIANILWLLAAFGIIHGFNEFLDMWAIIKGRHPVLDMIRWLILVISYIPLFEFGRRIFRLKISEAHTIRAKIAQTFKWWLTPLIVTFILAAGLFSQDFWITGSIWARYLLALPGGILIGIGFNSYYHAEREILESLRVKKYFFLAGAAFICYGILGGAIVPKGDFPPARFLNTDSFLLTVKIPVQVFRAWCAILLMWAVSGMLKIFNWEIRNKLQDAQNILKLQLQEAEDRYMQIVERSTDIIHFIDSGFLITRSNNHGCEKLGYTPDELVGCHIRNLCKHETWANIEKRFEQVKIEGAVFIDDGELLTKDGTKLHVAIHAMSIYANRQNLVGMVLTFRDITNRKQMEDDLRKSEERYRLLFEESRDAIYMTNHEGRFIDINRAGLDLFGYGREEIMRIDVNQIYANPDDRRNFQQAIEEKEFVRDYFVNMRKKSGKIMNCLITATVRRASDRHITGYQGIIRDVTEMKKMEEEIQKIEKLESIGIMAGGIAHDFNNILTTIVGNISIARASLLEDRELLEVLSDAQNACVQAKNLTHQLLAFSRGGAPIKKITDIKGLLQESIKFSLRGSNINCVLSSGDDLWPAEIDQGQIVQVMNNLIINACQAMPDGGTIDVIAENASDETMKVFPESSGKYIKVTVRDQGVGIPKEHLKNIFDPYFTTKEKGTGLGLTCTYSIIKNHQGYIDVHSEAGAGTTFYFYLPASGEKAEIELSDTDTILRGQGHILLMDDEESICKSVFRMLRHLGYDVAIARNGDEAVILYREARNSGTPFDVVIMDLTIRGGMGGKEAIQKLVEMDPGVKAIVSSGYSDDPIMADFAQYGFIAVMPKPYQIEDLGRLLQRVVGNRELPANLHEGKTL